MFARAMQSPLHPIVAQVVTTRRCNLACGYCSEYDHVSAPVPTSELMRRIDRLADLKTGIVTMTGGEPLLHPDLEALVAHVRRRGALATVITNGLLLTRERILRLNRAGLDYLQISIDNIRPDAVSKKSLAVLDRRLADLAALAEFQVTINSVVGACTETPEDALTIARRARSLGFTSTVGIVHDARGQLRPLGQREQAVVEAILRLAPSMFSFAQFGHFQRNILRGLPNQWHCRAGGRFLYVCEDGRVHFCSQQRGQPGIPLDACSALDLARAADLPKPCAPHCTVSCVHQVAMLDRFRERPRETLESMIEERRAWDSGFQAPATVRLLSWALLDLLNRDPAGRRARRMNAGVSAAYVLPGSAPGRQEASGP
jgi:MoaA/NifB/PqqE/SkfB family radical SAM enzyme